MKPEPLRAIDVLGFLVGVALAWVLAGSNDFSTGWKVFAFVITGAAIIGFIRRLIRR